jgi:hypothetical protein
MTDITEGIDKYRAALKEYDDGLLSSASCLADLNHLAIGQLLDAIENGDGYMTFGSCCCSYHPPDRTFTAAITIQPHGFSAKRCAKSE